MLFIHKFGQFEREYHKAWVLDQVSRILKGSPVLVEEARWSNGQSEHRFTVGEPSQAYLNWREEMLGRDASGTPQYDYDEGTCP